MRTVRSDTSGTGNARAFEILLHLPSFVRLYWRLLRDGRVSIWPKALLLGAIAYVVLPFDLIPDVIPIVGEIDDLVVLVLAARWFMQWCPPDVVHEHVRAMAAGRPARAG